MKWMEDFLVVREMRTVIRDQPSKWSIITNRPPQGSVLVPVMFTVFINDMAENITIYVSLFADDAKLLHTVKTIGDCKELQNDLDKIHD